MIIYSKRKIKSNKIKGVEPVPFNELLWERVFPKKNLTDERDCLKKANVRYTYIYIYI